MKLTSDDLLDRLKKKGTREPAFTKALIIKKLNDDDDDVATTSLKVRIILRKANRALSPFICFGLRGHTLITLACRGKVHIF